MNKEDTLKKVIKKAKKLYAEIEEAQKDWDVFYKHDSCRGKKFWALDRKITRLWKKVNKLPASMYQMNSLDDLLGYIEFRELNFNDDIKE